MKSIYQKRLQRVVEATQERQNTDAEFEKYKSALGMVHTLIEDGKLDELDIALKIHFPQYYYNTEIPILTSSN